MSSKQPILPAQSRGRFYRPELDLLRLLAFLLVFVTHSVPPRRARLSQFSHVGDLGLCLFFVLSSFLITELLLKEKERTGTIAIRSFYTRRVLRIWPLQYVFLVLTLILGLLGTRFQADRFALLAMALFVGNWYTGRHGFTGGIAFALWSISVEEQFYLLWPLLCRTLSRPLMLLVSFLLLPISAVAVTVLVRTHADPITTIWTNTFVQGQMFGMGAILAILSHGRNIRTRLPLRSIGVVAGFAMLFASILVFHIRDASVSSAASVIAGYLCAGAGSCLLLVSFLGTKVPEFLKPAVYLGKISYGLYVFHIVCLDLTNHWFGPANGVVTLLVKIMVALGFTCLLASISYRFLESPFIRLKEKFAIVKSRAA